MKKLTIKEVKQEIEKEWNEYISIRDNPKSNKNEIENKYSFILGMKHVLEMLTYREQKRD